MKITLKARVLSVLLCPIRLHAYTTSQLVNCWEERQKNIPWIVIIVSNVVIIMNCVLKFRNDLTDQKCDGYIQKPKGDFISCMTQPALVLKLFCCGQVKWDVKQDHVFWEMWGNATNCSSITGSCQLAYSSQKSMDFWTIRMIQTHLYKWTYEASKFILILNQLSLNLTQSC